MILSTLLLAACTQEPTKPDLAAGTYSGEGRDRWCISGERAGVIAYGPGDTNCSASGRLEGSGTGLALVPAGDGECRIPLSVDGNAIRIGNVAAACSYYCGPGATLAGKVFARDAASTPVTDLAGDPLC